jgi:hypothetical protein
MQLYTKKVFLPVELLDRLSVQEYNEMLEDIYAIYFRKKPESLNDIIEKSDGNTKVLEQLKKEEIERAFKKEYAFDIDILRARDNDELGEYLTEVIDDYNKKVEIQNPAEEKIEKNKPE